MKPTHARIATWCSYYPLSVFPSPGVRCSPACHVWLVVYVVLTEHQQAPLPTLGPRFRAARCGNLHRSSSDPPHGRKARYMLKLKTSTMLKLKTSKTLAMMRGSSASAPHPGGPAVSPYRTRWCIRCPRLISPLRLLLTRSTTSTTRGA